MKVYANINNYQDAVDAKEAGAEGIGLFRTERLFVKGENLNLIRKIIISAYLTRDERIKLYPNIQANYESWLDAFHSIQIEEIKKIYSIYDNVNIRLLDPPLHEFLPPEQDMNEIAKQMMIEMSDLNDVCKSMSEFNPMLGNRGSRVAIMYKEIFDTQISAIIIAAKQMLKTPRILLPMINGSEEFRYLRNSIIDIENEYNVLVGAMIETPRSLYAAGDIAKTADFLAFGTNDLTQMFFGMSRDDTGDVIKCYKEKEIYAEDPFEHLDKQLMIMIKTACDNAFFVNPRIKFTLCGKQAKSPATIKFCQMLDITISVIPDTIRELRANEIKV
jgi:pyruvate,orthophosphate dikinase